MKPRSYRVHESNDRIIYELEGVEKIKPSLRYDHCRETDR